MTTYVVLGSLQVYRLAIDISQFAWEMYDTFDWKDKKIMGDQYITSVDSVGANIAEGYGRYHYLDRIKFYYNSRGSLLEAKHWAYLLQKRKKISKETFEIFLKKADDLHYQLNRFIQTTYQTKDKKQNTQYP